MKLFNKEQVDIIKKVYDSLSEHLGEILIYREENFFIFANHLKNRILNFYSQDSNLYVYTKNSKRILVSSYTNIMVELNKTIELYLENPLYDFFYDIKIEPLGIDDIENQEWETFEKDESELIDLDTWIDDSLKEFIPTKSNKLIEYGATEITKPNASQNSLSYLTLHYMLPFYVCSNDQVSETRLLWYFKNKHRLTKIPLYMTNPNWYVEASNLLQRKSDIVYVPSDSAPTEAINSFINFYSLGNFMIDGKLDENSYVNSLLVKHMSYRVLTFKKYRGKLKLSYITPFEEEIPSDLTIINNERGKDYIYKLVEDKKVLYTDFKNIPKLNRSQYIKIVDNKVSFKSMVNYFSTFPRPTKPYVETFGTDIFKSSYYNWIGYNHLGKRLDFLDNTPALIYQDFLKEILDISESYKIINKNYYSSEKYVLKDFVFYKLDNYHKCATVLEPATCILVHTENNSSINRFINIAFDKVYESIEIPSKINIDNQEYTVKKFHYLNSIENVINNDTFCVEGDYILSADRTILYKFLGEYCVVPPYVKKLSSHCFTGDKIKEVICTDDIYFVEEQAFYKCNNLEKITFNSAIHDLDPSAFHTLYNLKELNLDLNKIKVLKNTKINIGRFILSKNIFLKNFDNDYFWLVNYNSPSDRFIDIHHQTKYVCCDLWKNNLRITDENNNKVLLPGDAIDLRDFDKALIDSNSNDLNIYLNRIENDTIPCDLSDENRIAIINKILFHIKFPGAYKHWEQNRDLYLRLIKANLYGKSTLIKKITKIKEPKIISIMLNQIAEMTYTGTNKPLDNLKVYIETSLQINQYTDIEENVKLMGGIVVEDKRNSNINIISMDTKINSKKDINEYLFLRMISKYNKEG